MMQLIAIFLVLFATLLNLIYSMIVLIKGIINIRDLLKFRNKKDEINKKYDAHTKSIQELAKKNISSSEKIPQQIELEQPITSKRFAVKLNKNLVLEKDRMKDLSKIDLHSKVRSEEKEDKSRKDEKIKAVSVVMHPRMNKFISD